MLPSKGDGAPSDGRPARFARTASATELLHRSLPPTRKAARRAALRGWCELCPKEVGDTAMPETL